MHPAQPGFGGNTGSKDLIATLALAFAIATPPAAVTLAALVALAAFAALVVALITLIALLTQTTQRSGAIPCSTHGTQQHDVQQHDIHGGFLTGMRCMMHDALPLSLHSPELRIHTEQHSSAKPTLISTVLTISKAMIIMILLIMSLGP
jgi:hypothetical protein